MAQSDSSIFSSFETQPPAYLLGWVAAGGITQTGFRLDSSNVPSAVLKALVASTSELPVSEEVEEYECNGDELVSVVGELLQPVNVGDVWVPTRFPDLGGQTWHFVRAYLEGKCGFNASQLLVVRGHPEFLAGFCNFTGCAPVNTNDESALFNILPTLDILHLSHDGVQEGLISPIFPWKQAYFSIVQMHSVTKDCSFRYVLTEEGAIPPSKGRASDSGYDLHLIRECKPPVGNTHFYTTGVAVQPMQGTYFDMVGRSSISKSGYICANFGVIDAGYTGPIIVALTKMDPSVPDLELPAKLVQLIPRRLILAVPQQVEALAATNRGGDGGIVR